MIKLNYSTHRELFLVALALPSFLGVLIFFIIPFVISLQMAMIDNPQSRNFVTFEHFVSTINNAAFRLAIRNTLRFMALSIPISMILAFTIASLLHNVNRKIRNFLSVFFILPLVVPSGSIVHFWRSIFGINGVLNRIFSPFEPINWLNTDFALWVIVFIFIWKNVGFNIVLYLAGLNLIPKEYYEYASTEGAGRFWLFSRITIVYLTPTTFMVFLMSIVMSFRAFREIFSLTGAYPHFSIYMLQHYMNNMFAAINYQRLAAASYILTAGIVAVVLCMFYIQRRVFNYD